MEPLAVPTTLVPILMGNISGCIPVEKVVESLPYLVLKSDALKAGALMLIVGIIIGIVFTVFWYRAGRRDPLE